MNKSTTKPLKITSTNFSIPINPSPERICTSNRQRNPDRNIVKRMTKDIQRRKYIKELSHACSTLSLKKSPKHKVEVYDRLVQDTNKRTNREVKLNKILKSQSKNAPKSSVEDSQVYERLFRDSQIRKERKNNNEKIYKAGKIDEKTLTSGIFQRILENSQETVRRGMLGKTQRNLLTNPQNFERTKIVSVLKSGEGSACEDATKEIFNEDELIEKLYGISSN